MNLQQSKPRIVRIAAYGIIIRKECEILLCRLSSDVSRHAGMWTLPGGGLEFGEHPEEGMVREVQEETGLNVRPVNLVGINSFTRERSQDSFQSIQIMYNTDIISGSLRHEQQGTTDMCKWHSVEKLDGLETVDLVDAALSMASLGGN